MGMSDLPEDIQLYCEELFNQMCGDMQAVLCKFFRAVPPDAKAKYMEMCYDRLYFASIGETDYQTMTERQAEELKQKLERIPDKEWESQFRNLVSATAQASQFG